MIYIVSREVWIGPTDVFVSNGAGEKVLKYGCRLSQIFFVIVIPWIYVLLLASATYPSQGFIDIKFVTLFFAMSKLFPFRDR